MAFLAFSFEKKKEENLSLGEDKGRITSHGLLKVAQNFGLWAFDLNIFLLLGFEFFKTCIDAFFLFFCILGPYHF